VTHRATEAVRLLRVRPADLPTMPAGEIERLRALAAENAGRARRTGDRPSQRHWAGFLLRADAELGRRKLETAGRAPSGGSQPRSALPVAERVAAARAALYGDDPEQAAERARKIGAEMRGEPSDATREQARDLLAHMRGGR
jgi:hypothetical protein